MEKWLADRPHHPGAAAKQWLIDLYKENRLAKGTFELGGETVDLKRLTMPVLNVYALQDTIIPTLLDGARTPGRDQRLYRAAAARRGMSGSMSARRARASSATPCSSG